MIQRTLKIPPKTIRINEFSKVEYKINIQKSVVLLYTINELSEKLRKQPYLHGIKIPRNKFNQGDKRPVVRKLLRH